jgi:hypothetical protein
MSEAATAALDKWAETANERSAIEEFLDWAVSQGYLYAQWSMSRADLLDKFYGINRADLELGRQQLINTLREDQDREVPNG